MIAMDEKDPIARVDSVIYLWEKELEKLRAEPFVPKLVKDQLDKLAKEGLIEQHAAEITLFAKKSRRITEVGAQHRRAQTALVMIAKEFKIKNDPQAGSSATTPSRKRKRESVDWSDLAQTSYVNAFRLHKQNQLQKAAANELKDFKLRSVRDPALMWALNIFRQVTSWKCLKHFTGEFYANMELFDLHNQYQENTFYLRKMITLATELWHRFELEHYRSNKEGWYLAMLHVPLMEIFRAIPYVDLCVTDMKGRNNSNGDKHDAVIYHQVFPLDLVVMEAKHHQQDPQMLEGSENISHSMAGNMQRAKELLPPSVREQKQDIMRSFGILYSGLDVTLLECRFMDDTPVVYEVRRFEVPDGPLLCSRFVDGLGYMIAFKNRVLDFVTELSETLANAPPGSSNSANRRTMKKFPMTKDKDVARDGVEDGERDETSIEHEQDDNEDEDSEDGAEEKDDEEENEVENDREDGKEDDE
ncbi:hypothetical protein BGZ59_004152 [Podila verticillata]|nr:hypothetical protein BGZ59_004152 [Podila verticillata]